MAAELTTTLYLRGVPRAVVRQAKAAAASEGVTLARWVTARITGAAPPRAPEPASDLASDLAYYETERSALERKYPGQYLAIIDRAIVDHDVSFDALAARVFQRHGSRPVCMPRVGRGTVHVRSPRRAAR